MFKGKPGSDVLLSIKAIHMNNIASRLKLHGFRNYVLPPSAKHMWFYTTAPEQRSRYIAVISKGTEPGEISGDDTGLGNEDFNAGRTKSYFAHEILELYELSQPLSLETMIKEGYVKAALQTYQWVPKRLIDQITSDGQKRVF
jgi:hypothetical protein